MGPIRSKEVAEAADLLAAVSAWPDEEVAALPRFYREKAQEYRQRAAIETE
ncbi:hypothetical protein [Halorussus salinisoli]|uniref:hypothetical protein n=1 Tax=Halorussus salinisoli TaxID=2558242 RepID=UPI00148586DD|nr:hypothetical protein [Halorussus salinisoli]